MVGNRSAWSIKTAALVSALLASAAAAQDIATPAAAVGQVVMLINEACGLPTLKIVGTVIAIYCDSVISNQKRTLGTFSELTVSLNNLQLIVEALAADTIDKLTIYGVQMGEAGVKPTLKFVDGLAGLSELSSLSLSNVNFLSPSINLKLPDTLADLTIESTNAKDVSLKVSDSSSLKTVTFEDNQIATIPKCLYERQYNSKLTANVGFAQITTEFLAADTIATLAHNIDLANSTFDIDNACGLGTAGVATVGTKYHVCALTGSAMATPSSNSSSASPSTPATPAPVTDETSSSSSTTLLVVVIAGVVVALALLVILVRRFAASRKRKASESDDNSVNLIPSEDPPVPRNRFSGKLKDESDSDTTTGTSTTGGKHSRTLVQRTSDSAALWNDRELLSVRVSVDDIQDIRMVGSGAFADVWLVKFRDATFMASKRLRKNKISLQYTEAFISEIKLVKSLEHPHIVQFIGVAWVMETDLQALFEYMERGDLRTYLVDTAAANGNAVVPPSWSTEKLQIAIDVVEALVFVHSFSPPLVHRDLKSLNILLSSDMQAKLTDFGTTRERSDNNTMTMGVGTGRWIAPEVVSGSQDYGPAADIYSIGVVLAELDSHALPYEGIRGANGNRLPEVAILQKVSTGELRPSFRAECPEKIVEIANRCLALNPDDRPGAPELAYALRTIMKQMLTGFYV